MNKLLRSFLIILSIPVLLLIFTVIHETGHTLTARLFGDRNSTFYLVKIDEQGTCLGCNISDHTKLSHLGNLAVSISGLLFTQVSAVLLLLLARKTPGNTFQRRLLLVAGFIFVMDVPAQVLQGLLYDITSHTFPTGVDLMDFMLLVSQKTGSSQVFLKLVLALLAGVYLYAIYRLSKPLSRATQLA